MLDGGLVIVLPGFGPDKDGFPFRQCLLPLCDGSFAGQHHLLFQVVEPGGQSIGHVVALAEGMRERVAQDGVAGVIGRYQHEAAPAPIKDIEGNLLLPCLGQRRRHPFHTLQGRQPQRHIVVVLEKSPCHFRSPKGVDRICSTRQDRQ